MSTNMLHAAAKLISLIRMEAELSDSETKDSFPPDLHIKIYEEDFCVMGRALIIYVIEVNVEDILNSIVLFFRQEDKLD